jgi:hypothetical protein
MNVFVSVNCSWFLAVFLTHVTAAGAGPLVGCGRRASHDFVAGRARDIIALCGQVV